MADNENAEAADAQTNKPVGEDDQTAKIPRPGQTSDDGKVVLNSSTDSTIKPSDATRIAPAIPQVGSENKPPVSPTAKPVSAKTIKLKPVSDAVPDEDRDVGETISVDRKDLESEASPQVAAPEAAPIAKPTKSKTIKLKPLKPTSSIAADNELGDTLSLDKDSLSDIPADSLKSSASAREADSEDEEATIKIQKPSSSKKPSHPVPNMPGGKETIKLRPSNNTPPPPSAPTVNLQDPAQAPQVEGKRTIKLVPKKATEDDATQKTPKPPGPSDPTVNLKEVVETPAASPPSPSAPTMKMPADGEKAPAKPSAKRTLKLKSAASSAPAAPSPADDATATDTGVPAMSDSSKAPSSIEVMDTGGEPNIIFTLVALVSLGLLAYFTYLAGTQLMALNG
ncbi:MAG: hypothetical protein GXP32_10580 [Kiritimatiellaeota bacterium]|nr:hypothetical protein [Kiritimatiellota bacterium]